MWQSVRDQEMVEVAGGKPAGVGESTPVKKRDKELSPEALTHIFTNFTDEDLSHAVTDRRKMG